MTKKAQQYVIARGSASGVHAGYLVSQAGAEVVLRQARRIWYWAGAASLSELAARGTSKPLECKFPIANERVIKTDVCEIIYATDVARESIESVAVWTCA